MVQSDRPQITLKYRACVLHAGYLRLQTQTDNKSQLLLFHSNNVHRTRLNIMLHCVLHAGYLRLQTQTDNMSQLLLFHSNNINRKRLNITLHVRCLPCYYQPFLECYYQPFFWKRQTFCSGRVAGSKFRTQL